MSSLRQPITTSNVADKLSNNDLPITTAAEDAQGKEEGSLESVPNEDLPKQSELARGKMEGPKEPPSPTKLQRDGPIEGPRAFEAAAALAEPTPSHDTMESSTATLKPDTNQSSEPSIPASPQFLSPDDHTYEDPTPKTPKSSNPPSRSTSNATSIPHYTGVTHDSERSPTRSDVGFDEKQSTSEDEREGTSRTEIQNIMDQFSEYGQGPGHEEVMSPRLEFAGPLLGNPIQHPPRKSSLEPLNASTIASMENLQIMSSTSSSNPQLRDLSDQGPAVPPKAGSIRSFRTAQTQSTETPASPSIHRPPPPEPEPEPDLPFDFHRFLEQLRHRTADPVAKFLRSFLQEFGKKIWMVHEQVKIIRFETSFPILNHC
jgi:hypothetical protein